MCLIIQRPAGTSNVPNDVLEYNRKKNSDGFGIAWREGGEVKHAKFGPKDYDTFHALLKSIDRNLKIEYVAHFRMATHGAPCERLSHPFVYDDTDGRVAVFHNGIININPDQGESDTSTFVQRVLAKMEARWWRNPAYRFLVERSISGSRFLVMDSNDTVRLNENLWNKRDGIWYSTDALPRHHNYKSVGGMYMPTGTPTGTFIPAGTKMPEAIVKPVTSPTSGWSPASGRAVGIPATKGYNPPKEWLLPEGLAVVNGEVVDTSEPGDDIEIHAPGHVDAMDEIGFRHDGHWVVILDDEFSVGPEDTAAEIECEDCGAEGEIYSLNNKVYVDLKHNTGWSSMEDSDSDEQVMAEVRAM